MSTAQPLPNISMNLDTLCWKKVVLVTSEILGLFVNTLTVEYMYTVAIRRISGNNFKLSYLRKEKLFSGFFIAFLKCTSSLEHLEKEDEASSLSILEIIDSIGSGYLNV